MWHNDMTYIYIGFSLPTFGGYMTVGGCLCALWALGWERFESISPSFDKVFLSHLEIAFFLDSWRVSVRPLGAGLGNKKNIKKISMVSNCTRCRFWRCLRTNTSGVCCCLKWERRLWLWREEERGGGRVSGGNSPFDPLWLAPPNSLDWSSWGGLEKGFFHKAISNKAREIILFARIALLLLW